MDTGQKTGQEQQLVYHCFNCKYDFRSRDAAVKHRQRYHHHCAGIDVNTGEILDEIGKGRGPAKVVSPPPRRPVISAEGDEHIKEHAKGYSKDGESILFVLYPNGTIRDLRFEQPLLYPIFQLMKKEREYKGDFPQFIADAVETLFANAGYELTLAPKSQSMIYQEVMRLLDQGQLELVCQEDQVTLGVKDGYKDERAQGPDSSPGEGPGVELPQQGREEEPGESE